MITELTTRSGAKAAPARYEIAEFAHLCGLSVDTIRFYQSRGILMYPARQGRKAYYGPEHLDRIKQIRNLQDRGLSLREIKSRLDDDSGVASPEPSLQLDFDEFSSRIGLPSAIIRSLIAEGLLIPLSLGGRKLGVHGIQGVDQQVDHRPIPIPLVVGGNHEPRGEVVGARLDDAAVLSHEVVPSLTRIEVGGRELPTLVGLVDSLLHALALLVLGDVQEDFHYGRSGFDQVLLEGMDGLQPPFLLGGVDEVQDAGGDDVLVMAPIEDPDLATTGERTIDPPEELVLEFLAHWRAKAAHRNALRVNTPEHPADSTVLASCVERLENEQERAFGFGPEPPLQRLETEMQGENRLVQFGLSLGDTWGARALQLVEVKARSGLYAQVLFGMREFRG